ncbi:MAG: 50S ribosomal protein L11 methyltransferase [Saprospiraceae bacterium]|nr:50S ribosomal protein L11 methyltransferase [Saprospiraceae bacterium]
MIENLDELFEALVNKGSDHPDVVDERIPYWADLWASAIGLSQYLADHAMLVEGKKVLEIGCGLGLPAIFAGKLGATKTIATDYLPEALDFAQLNWTRNLALDTAQFDILDWRNIPEFKKNTPPQYKPDILLAADVAYEKRAFSPLLNAFEHLVKPEGTILIAEPNRYISKGLFKELRNFGFSVKKTRREVERREDVFTVNIFELKRV